MILLADKEAEALHERSLTEAEEVCFLWHLVSVCCADVAYYLARPTSYLLFTRASTSRILGPKSSKLRLDLSL